MNEIHVAFRPITWHEFEGKKNKSVIKAIQRSLKDGMSRAFLMTGPPGVGKTTLARLIAREVQVDPDGGASAGYEEFDGATNTGVDDIRHIRSMARRRPLGGGTNQVFVIDECHMLSKNAWNAMLKIVEEPPTGVHWVFCTSEASKVPASIKSRCQSYALAEIDDAGILGILNGAADTMDSEVPDAVLDLIVGAVRGNPRDALVAFGKVAHLNRDSNLDEAKSLIEGSQASENAEVIDFCRMLGKGAKYTDLARKAVSLQGKANAEGVRCVVCAYFTKVAVTDNWKRAAAILLAFGDPYPPGLGNAIYPVLVSLSELID